jgi:anti-sigma28 factor (negative regulator of flagellin synthesis)
MSAINGVGNNSPIQNIPSTAISKSAEAGATPTGASDRLELSGVSHLLASLKSNDIRVDKVADIKAQIESGKYDDDYKLDVAAGRLLDDLTK